MPTEPRLLPRDALIVTGPVDHADWNYRPVLSWISRQRYRLASSVLPPEPVARLLEIGYGSGIFLPTLAERCRSLHGIDIHDRPGEVEARLAERGIAADLATGSAAALPYEDSHFDVVVTVSTLEFIDELDQALDEIRRVLRPQRHLIVVTPGDSKILDAGLFLLTGTSAKRDFGDRRSRVLPALTSRFTVRRRRTFPGRPLGSFIPAYVCLDLVAR